MWWSYIGNVILGVIMLITMLFCIGPLDGAIATTTPYLTLFTNTNSTGVALALTIIVFFLIYSGNITALATASREVWAFSRDKGFPFSRWISRVSHSSFCRTLYSALTGDADEPYLAHSVQQRLPDLCRD